MRYLVGCNKPLRAIIIIIIVVMSCRSSSLGISRIWSNLLSNFYLSYIFDRIVLSITPFTHLYPPGRTANVHQQRNNELIFPISYDGWMGIQIGCVFGCLLFCFLFMFNVVRKHLSTGRRRSCMHFHTNLIAFETEIRTDCSLLKKKEPKEIENLKSRIRYTSAIAKCKEKKLTQLMPTRCVCGCVTTLYIIQMSVFCRLNVFCIIIVIKYELISISVFH